MSSMRRRGRGKRPRHELELNNHAHASAPHLLRSQYTPSYPDSDFSREANAFGDQSSVNAPFPDSQTQPHNDSAGPPRGKIAIPPLRSAPQRDLSQGGKKGRTSHACDYCRKAKAGCTGGQPCSRCRTASIPCVYGDGKRDRERKQLSQLTTDTVALSQQNSDILDGVRRIRSDTSLSANSMRAALDELLSGTAKPHITVETEEYSEDDDSASEQGSTESLDAVKVDADRETMGHIGKASSVAWARRTTQEYETTTGQGSESGRNQACYTLTSYHTEDADIVPLPMNSINAFDWPDHDIADKLLQLYLDEVHTMLPLLDKQHFLAEYGTFARGSANVSSEGRIRLGTVNIVFAIAAVYAQLTGQHSLSRPEDHLIYIQRAKLLCLSQDLVLQDARLSMSRVLGLFCLYYLSTGMLNRAWAICGLAMRQSVTLGLHIKNHADGISNLEKEHRVRYWWSLYSLECTLDTLTGRACCISDQDISTPLPLNIDENDLSSDSFPHIQSSTSGGISLRTSRSSQVSDDRPTATYQLPVGSSQPLVYAFPNLALPTTSSTYFIYYVQLSIISHEVMTQLYCAATTKTSWGDIRNTIRRIESRHISWQESLPEDFSILFDEWTEPDWSSPHILQRLGLALMFNSSRMLLFRPCLCRFRKRMESQTTVSSDFSQKAAETCIHSARKMISLMRWSASSNEKLYAIPPWWNVLHHICEALSVLMLEMAFQAHHLPDEAAYIFDDAKTGVRWLRMMASESVSARKAWEIYDSLIRLVAPMIHWSVFDIPTEAPVPPGYNWQRFSAASNQLSAHTGNPNQYPGEQLNQANLEEHQTTHANVSQPMATSAWNQEQPFAFEPSSSLSAHQGFTTNEPHQQQHQQQSSLTYEEVRNPLDHTTAIHKFGSIGRLHGHYDEPWQHMFVHDMGGDEDMLGDTSHETMLGHTHDDFTRFLGTEFADSGQQGGMEGEDAGLDPNEGYQQHVNFDF